MNIVLGFSNVSDGPSIIISHTSNLLFLQLVTPCVVFSPNVKVSIFKDFGCFWLLITFVGCSIFLKLSFFLSSSRFLKLFL